MSVRERKKPAKGTIGGVTGRPEGGQIRDDANSNSGYLQSRLRGIAKGIQCLTSCQSPTPSRVLSQFTLMLPREDTNPVPFVSVPPNHQRRAHEIDILDPKI